MPSLVMQQLTRRERELLEKFRSGYEAWCVPRAGLAHLIPPTGVTAPQETVRVDTLWHMTEVGVLVQTEDDSPSRDIRWKAR